MLPLLFEKITGRNNHPAQGDVYIHIGISKTGTTAIQKFLHKNTGLLASRGFHYIQSGRAKGGVCHHHLARLYKGGLPRDGEIGAIRDEMVCSGSRNFVISSEMFEYLDRPGIKQLKRDFEGYNVILVVYVRYQDYALSSMYNELVKKHACANSFAEHMRETPRKGLLLYAKMLKPWERELGAENVRVRVFDRERMVGGNVIQDMLSAIGVDISGAVLPESDANPSVSAVAIQVLRDINSEMHYSIDHAAHYGLACKLGLILDKLVRSRFPALGHDARSYLSARADYDELMSYYRRDNQLLSRRYFSGQEFSPGKFAPAEDLSEETKREILLALAGELQMSGGYEEKDAVTLARLIAEFWSGRLKSLVA